MVGAGEGGGSLPAEGELSWTEPLEGEEECSRMEPLESKGTRPPEGQRTWRSAWDEAPWQHRLNMICSIF